MTTIIGDPSPPPPAASPAERQSDPANPAAPLPPHSLALRALERFAFIAFALYHLPLFVNNYPSLGGGGFNNTGLAPKWGHVFTPVGIGWRATCST